MNPHDHSFEPSGDGAPTTPTGSGTPVSQRARTLILAVTVLIAGVFAGWWVGSQTHLNNPYTSCEASRAHLKDQVTALAAIVNIKTTTRPEIADNIHRHLWELTAPFDSIRTVFQHSPCDPEELFTVFDFETTDEPHRTVLAHLAVELAAEFDIPNLPEDASRLLAVREEPGKPRPVVVPEDLARGAVLVVYADEPCACYQDLAEAVTNLGDVTVIVAGESETAAGLAETHGWELRHPDSLLVSATITTQPTAVLVRNGVVIDRLEGEGAVAWGPNPEILAYPLDPAAEPVHTRLVGTLAACDGHRAAGVVVNHTDRPIHAALITDPNVHFGDDGLLISERRYHDLGVIEAFGHTFFEVGTGENFYAPCWFLVDAVYVDGEWRGPRYHPETWPPEGVVTDPQILIEEAGFELPEQIRPKGLWPGPSDVRPVPEEERMR